jgi:hypothetical protein
MRIGGFCRAIFEQFLSGTFSNSLVSKETPVGRLLNNGMPPTPNTSSTNSNTELRPIRQRILDWLAISTTVILGLYTLIDAAFHAAMPDYNSITLGIAFISFALLVSVPIALRHRKRTAIFLLIAGPIADFWLFWWYRTVYYYTYAQDSIYDIFVENLIALAFLWIPAAFWLVTHRLRWPELRGPSTMSIRSSVMTTAFVLIALYVIASIGVIYQFGRVQPVGDCGETNHVVTGPNSPNDAMFVAKIIQIGYPRGIVNGRIASMSALAIVKEKFWGLPSWNSKLVILTKYVYYEGDEYLIYGTRRGNWLTLGLPLFESHLCGLSLQIQDAEIQLRIMHDGPPKSGIRIIGRTMRWPYGNNAPLPHGPMPGAKVLVSGPSGTFTAISDSHGIYDVSNLPTGHYTIRSSNEHDPVVRGCDFTASDDPASNPVWTCTVYLR